ncbi:MAG: DUF3267 domain-containing protein [Anaerolineales bacterium]|nr:DUF3267 domain-containing protein [Anaerolineales bacterium]
MSRLVTQLPDIYEEKTYMRLTEARLLLALNLAALGVLAIAAAIFFGWLYFYHRALAGFAVLYDPARIDFTMILVMVLSMIVGHEWLHGLAIQYYGHPVRYGMKWTKLTPYATSDSALFWRNQFIGVALAPLVGIAAMAWIVSWVTGPMLGAWIGMIAALNAAGSIGDIWMTRLALRFEADVLIRDEEDGMRVFGRR